LKTIDNQAVVIFELHETTYFVDDGIFTSFFPWPCALVARILQSASENTAIYERAVFTIKASLLASIRLHSPSRRITVSP
jgi:hypothetical protein